jgi:hypothetical protein
VRLTVASSEEFLGVGLAFVALSTEGLGHGEVDLEVLAINVTVSGQCYSLKQVLANAYPTRAPTTLACAA